NHDSASRIDVYRNLWEQINVHVIGKIERKNKEYLFEGNIIEIKNKGFIVAIPFINRAFMNLPGGGENIERHFFNEIGKVVKEKNIYGLPVILMSHLSVTECDTEGHRFSQIGNLNSVSAEIFNEGYDYIALGHIHKPQTIDSHNRIRYSGSPIQISFDEKYEHSVSIVDIVKGASPQIKEIVINPLRSLLTIPETPTSFNKALKLLSKLPSEETAYIRLNIEQADDLPSDCEERAVNAASGKSCRYCLIKYNREKQRKEESQFKELHIDDFLSSSPIDIADRFFRSMGFEEEKVIQFNSLIRELMSEIEQKKQS
ncbi:MAG: exonuclease SbcCD subunit D C-terminal domain-containing protein, partial [Muribaculaceae bacterium]|nr:exonuclease SbcCD subunit D C-terminal domain-containing protein [Muribaculaceae bacterium]